MNKKNHYFGGFLYHPDSQKFLLQQTKNEEKEWWDLLGGFGEKSFQSAVTKILKLKIHPNAVLPIYDYVVKGKRRFVFYAELKKLMDFPPKKNFSFKWFTLKEISKLSLPGLAKQDIIVGQRVINSSVRKASGERTIG